MAGIQSFFSVRETPWHLGTVIKDAPKTSKEIIDQAKLDWTVSTAPLLGDLKDGKGNRPIQNWTAVYRDDNRDILSVLNKKVVSPVQNVDMFNSIEPLINNTITSETAASLGSGEHVFGCFKINDSYKVADDDIDHYFVIFNDFTKSDGKVTILNTPVRVVCENTLSAALTNNVMKLRIPVMADQMSVSALSQRVIESSQNAQDQLTHYAERLLKQKVTKDQVNSLLDELFPYIELSNDSIESSHDKANEKTTLIRDTFINDCLKADNLANYNGTAYQVFNAITDFSQHYWTSTEAAYDLDKRMSTLPGYGISDNVSKVTKTLQFLKKVA